jgi:hypothetical protein
MLSRNPSVCAAELDGEICLFHPDTAEYLNLNATGSAVWTLLDAPMDLEQLLPQLLERYSVDEATCRHETESFLAEALRRGMLLEESSPA